MAKIKKTDNTKSWRGYGVTKTLTYCWLEKQNVTATLEKFGGFLGNKLTLPMSQQSYSQMANI